MVGTEDQLQQGFGETQQELRGIISGVGGQTSSPVHQPVAPIRKSSTWVPLTPSQEQPKSLGENPPPVTGVVHTVLRPDAKHFPPLPLAELEGSQLDVSRNVAEEYPPRAAARHKLIAYNGRNSWEPYSTCWPS